MKLGKIDTRRNRIKMNLQLFAEPSTEIQNPTGHSEPTVSEMIQALFAEGATDTGGQPLEQSIEQQPAAQEQIEQPQTEQPATDTPQDGNGEVVPVQRYKDVQAFATKKSQEAAEYKKQNEELAQQLQVLSQQQQVTQQPQSAQPQQEDLTSLDPQAFIDKLYENPQAVLKAMIDSNIKPLADKVTPVIDTVNARTQQEKWENAVRSFAQEKPDMADFVEQIQEYIAENNLGEDSDPNKVLKNAYFYAKGLNYQPPQQVDPKSFLQDANFVNENILNNPEIVNQILKAQAQKLQDGKPPVSIASNGGGQQIATPVNKPTTSEEIRQRVRSILSGNNG